MKDVFNDFMRLFINALLVICLMFASYLLILNLFHYKEMNYKYLIPNSDIETINAIRTEFDLVKSNVDSSFSISDVNTKNASEEIRNSFNSCLSSFSESSIYKADSSYYIDYNLAYDFNNEVKENLSNKCLFTITYDISNILDKYNLDKSSFDVIANDVKTVKLEVDSNTLLIENRLLSNSKYSYSSDVFKETIYDDLKDNMSVVYNDYEMIAKSVTSVSEWYKAYFGGAI